MVHTSAYKTTIKYFTPTKKKRKLKLSDIFEKKKKEKQTTKKKQTNKKKMSYSR